MKIILLKDVSKVGRHYETKDVSDGYAQNLLIPRGLAVAATPDNVKRIGLEKAKTEAERKVHEELLAKNLADLAGKTVTVTGKANEKGHLFAGLHREEIAALLQQQTRLQIDPSHIVLEHPIKELGEHTIEISAGDKKAAFKIVVDRAE